MNETEDQATPECKVELTETVHHDPVMIDAESEDELEVKTREAWEDGRMLQSESGSRFNIEEVTDGQHVWR